MAKRKKQKSIDTKVKNTVQKKNISKRSSKKTKGLTKKKKEQKQYFPEVDLVKAFAALLVILIHVTDRYRGLSDNMFLFYDLIHFSVGLFVLVSGFLLQNSDPVINDLKDLWKFSVKKFQRIVVPYYIFAVVFVVVLTIAGKIDIANYFDLDRFVDTVFLWGGVGNNWIPRLFMSLMLVVGIERLISKYFKQIPYLIFSISLAGSIYLMTRDLDFLLKFNNLPGWIVIFYTGRYIYTKYEDKTFLYLFFTGAVLAIVLNRIFVLIGLNTTIFSNKYPPNLYFVAYNIAMSVLVWGGMYLLRDLAQKSTKIWGLVKFISRNSYEIFFYQFLIMAFWEVKIHWFVDWVIISAMTISFIYIMKLVIGSLKNGGVKKRK